MRHTGAGYPVLLFAPGFLTPASSAGAATRRGPGVAQDWVDPIPVLSPHFRVIALDVRNAGQSGSKLSGGRLASSPATMSPCSAISTSRAAT